MQWCSRPQLIVRLCGAGKQCSRQRVSVSYGRVRRCGSLLRARVGREHSKLQNKQRVAKNGILTETMQARALQCLAAKVDNYSIMKDEAWRCSENGGSDDGHARETRALLPWSRVDSFQKEATS